MSHPNLFAFLLFSSLLLSACGADNSDVELTENQKAAVAERIAPAGHVLMEGQSMVSSEAATNVSARSGDDIYNTNCMACHNSGIAGAPKYGDASAWALKLEKGIDAVYANAINGIRGMPARGTCMSCSDDEVKTAIDYILANSK